MAENKYAVDCKGRSIDVYDVLNAFGVTCPAAQHAIKKLLMPGKRWHKSELGDLLEARASVDRAIDLARERKHIVAAEREHLRYGLRLPGCIIAPDSGPTHRNACLEALALHAA